MSLPNKVLPPSGVIYDELQGTCLPDSSVIPPSNSPEDRYESISLSRIQYEAFAGIPSVDYRTSLWNHRPAEFSPWAMIPLACSLDTTGAGPNAPGDPIAYIQPLGAETTLNTNPLKGNVNGVDLAGEGSQSAVAWSQFDSVNPAQTGTFTFLRSGESGGSIATVSSDSSALHLNTSAAVLENGETVVVYTKATGSETPSSLVAQRISSSGSPVGDEIVILPEAVRKKFPSAQVVATSTGFVAVYRDGEGGLAASAFDLNGNPRGTLNLGNSSSNFAIARGAGEEWALAEFSSSNQIRVRTFSRTSPTGIDTTITTTSFPSDPDISIAMQEDGTMMVAWNTQNAGIRGATLSASGAVAEGPFAIRDSGLAHTLDLASDHRGNYVFTWEEGGRINARIYNGTSRYGNFAEFAVISSGFGSFDAHASVSSAGVLSLAYVKSSNESGNVQLNIARRDYRIGYQ